MDHSSFLILSSVDNNNSLHSAAVASFGCSLRAQKPHVSQRGRRNCRILPAEVLMAERRELLS